MKKYFAAIMAMLLMSLLFVSCNDSSDTGDVVAPRVYIHDEADALSAEIVDSINNIELMGNPLVVVTVDSINMANLPAALDSLMVSYPDSIQNIGYAGIMVVGVKSNNTCYIKYGRYFDGIDQTPIEYASNDYYAAQIDASIPFETKVYEMSRSAVDGSKYINDAMFSNFICGEMLGPLFRVIEPSDRFFYKYIIYPAQYPILKLIDLTGSLYLGLLLFGVIMFGLLRLTGYLINTRLIPILARDKRKTKKMLLDEVQALSSFTDAMLWHFPWIVGALSITSVFCFSGLENVSQIHEYMGLSYTTIHRINMSNVSSTSFFWMIAGICTIYMSMYENWLSRIKSYFFICVCVFTCAGINYALTLYGLPVAVLNFKHRYDDLRVHGVGKKVGAISTIWWMIATAIGVVLGSGCADGFDRVFGASHHIISTLNHNEADMREPAQLLPIQQPMTDEDTAIAQYMQILSPLEVVKNSGVYATYRLSIDCHEEMEDVLMVFSKSIKMIESRHVEHFDKIEKGKQDLVFTCYVGAETKLNEPVSIAIPAPELAENLVINGDRLKNESKDTPVVVKITYKNDGVVYTSYVYLKPLLGVRSSSEIVKFETFKP